MPFNIIRSIKKIIARNIHKVGDKNSIESISSVEPIYPLYCVLCERYYKKFTPISPYYAKMAKKYGFPYSIHEAETLNIKQYTCPGCGINDRDRLSALFLKETIDLSVEYQLIEFAPSKQISKFIKKFASIHHRTADLFMEGVDDKVDLMDLNIYSDNQFDIFICSHILEHVNNDVKAMSELYRILKPGGFGIAMVPILRTVKDTLEDPSIKSEALRWKYFGQDDHVRLYSHQEYVNRLKRAGFKVNEYDKHHFGDDFFAKNGLADSSILYVVEK